jgi:aryl-alcohol dehydrogenase-like predicted oxidoreductase
VVVTEVDRRAAVPKVRAMERRHIGVLEVSVVGLGCNNFGMRITSDEAKAVVDAALDAGINYFDTAESYGDGRSETFLGAAVKGRRDEVLLATKWGGRGSGEHPGSASSVRAALEGSLARLGTDHLDHHQLHRPDPSTPIADTLGVLAELRAEGKVREIGCSNFTADQLHEAAAVATELGVAPFASVQNHYSLLTRDPEHDGVLAACERDGVAFVPYFPLESGVLTGKYRAGEPPPEGTRLAAWGPRAGSFMDDDRMALVERLTRWAGERDRSILDLAMSWLVTNPQVATVIAGATSPAQVQANTAAAGWSLTDAERAVVERILTSS